MSVSVIENLVTVRAETITEIILETAGPIIFETFLLEFIAFRLKPVRNGLKSSSLGWDGQGVCAGMGGGASLQRVFHVR